MNTYEKSFSNDSIFPFELVYKDTKEVEVELPYHFHEWYEIVYVYSGEGKFFIDQSILKMEEGDIFIIPGNTLHNAIPNRKNPVTSTALFFNPLLLHNRMLGDTFNYLQIFDTSLKTKVFKFQLVPNEQKAVGNFIETIHEELHEGKIGYRHAILLELQQLLLYLGRTTNSPAQAQASPEFSGPVWMKEILQYIEDNFTEELTLDELSKFANVSKAHLSRVFKKVTGFNITTFITTKRIIKAKELLLTTEDTIDFIAFQSGFESMPYFHRTFKKIIGTTPSNFRKS